MPTEITLTDLKAKLERQDPIVVAEILPAAHYRQGHIPGAVNLPLDGFEQSVRGSLFDPGAEVVVYCAGPTCANSHLAAKKLGDLGFTNVRVFTGGKAAWKDAGRPLEASYLR